MKAIVVSHVEKEFSHPVSCKGPWYHKVSQYFFPKKKRCVAVSDISFSIDQGERVAFIGPNGAGKSTTIKMLTGIIQPTRGMLEVLSKDPVKDRKSLAYEMSAVFGQLSKLWYHLSVEDSFSLLRAMYDIPHASYKKQLHKLVERFEIGELLSKTARQLSLGERMRCELVASFLHKPKVIFLDEPTIGLDVTAKTRIRDLLCSVSQEEKTTLLLTSHDTDDIESVCDRVIVLNKGKIVIDDSLEKMKRYIKKKIIEIITEEETIRWEHDHVQVMERAPHRMKIEIDLTKTSSEKVIRSLLHECSVKDLVVLDPSLETIIMNIYQHEQVH